jgi:cell division GTPase FtsZ
VVGITDIIVKPGLINVDFADVRAVMADAGTALMGTGFGQWQPSPLALDLLILCFAAIDAQPLYAAPSHSVCTVRGEGQ